MNPSVLINLLCEHVASGRITANNARAILTAVAK